MGSALLPVMLRIMPGCASRAVADFLNASSAAMTVEEGATPPVEAMAEIMVAEATVSRACLDVLYGCAG